MSQNGLFLVQKKGILVSVTDRRILAKISIGRISVILDIRFGNPGLGMLNASATVICTSVIGQKKYLASRGKPV